MRHIAMVNYYDLTKFADNGFDSVYAVYGSFDYSKQTFSWVDLSFSYHILH